MKKMIYIIIGIAIIIVLFGIFKWWGSNKNKHEYLTHFSGHNSELFIDCKEDSECKLVNLTRGCDGLEAININNIDSDIEKFNNKESRLIKDVTFDCNKPRNIDEYQPQCFNNVCTVVKKDEINEANVINQNNEAMQGKIASPKEVKVSLGKIQFIAPNSFDQPSLVIAKEKGKIIWQIELANPEIDSNLEKDVQILDYFVTEMKIDKFESKSALYVTIGDGMKAKTYVLDTPDGELLNLMIISPPPVE